MGFQKAKREQLWLKILLAGPSGSGKTYSALRLAKGIAEAANSRYAAIDTENGRIRYYANEFDFDDLQLEAPYTPEKYIEAINTAVSAGYKVLIVDSITHEWDYCIDIHDKMPGNSYTNWGKVTPRHDAFMEKILQSPIHKSKLKFMYAISPSGERVEIDNIKRFAAAYNLNYPSVMAAVHGRYAYKKSGWKFYSNIT